MKYIISGFCLIFLSYMAQSQGVSVNPATISFSAEHNQAQTKKIRLSNSSNQKKTLQLSLSDWDRDSTGSHVYARPGSITRSCVSWVSLDKSVVDLEPGQSAEVQVTLKRNGSVSTADSMRWAMLFVRDVQEKDNTKTNAKGVKTQVKESFQIGIHIYQTPPSLYLKQADAVSLQPTGKEKNSYLFKVANTGEVMLRCTPTLELTDIATGKEYKISSREFPIFPDGKRLIEFRIGEDIPKGRYSALAIIDYGEKEEMQAIEKTIEVI